MIDRSLELASSWVAMADYDATKVVPSEDVDNKVEYASVQVQGSCNDRASIDLA